MPDGTRRRRSERYPLSLKVELGSGDGVTKDISATGLFFECEQGFARGSPMEVVIVFDQGEAGGELRLRCLGTVVRVEDRGGRIGVGAKITSRRLEGS